MMAAVGLPVALVAGLGTYLTMYPPLPTAQPMSDVQQDPWSRAACMAGGRAAVDDEFTMCNRWDWGFDGDVDLADFAAEQILEVAADHCDPTRWLVVYSAAWAARAADYMAWRGVPPTNGLPVDVPAAEVVDCAVYDVLRGILLDHLFPAGPTGRVPGPLGRRITGILVMGLPGGCDRLGPWSYAGTDRYPDQGGYSIANSLGDLSRIPQARALASAWAVYPVAPSPHWKNPHPPGRRGLGAGRYLTARIDGVVGWPSERTFARGAVAWDATDPSYGRWMALSNAVGCCGLEWREFDSDSSEPPDDLMGWLSWHSVAWAGRSWGSGGPRLVAVDGNSFGAWTVRDTGAHHGCFVPNAIARGGFAAAIGATAEPYQSALPDVGTLMRSLDAGECLGAAAFGANRHARWTVELDGDPLLRLEYAAAHLDVGVSVTRNRTGVHGRTVNEHRTKHPEG
jgi:hypothetical protein